MNSDMATPAGRVFHALGRCMESNNENNLRDVYKQAFKLDPSATDAEVMQCVGLLSCQLQLARQDLARYEEKDEGVEHTLKLIESMLSNQPLGIRWADVKQRQGMNLFSLRALDRRVKDNNDQESVADEVSVNNMRQDLDSFIEKVLASDIETDLKRVLIDCLELARQSLISYDLLGVTALVAMRDRIVGFMCMHPEAKKRYEEEREGGSGGIFTIVCGFIAKVNTIIQFGKNTQDLLEQVTDLPKLPQ